MVGIISFVDGAFRLYGFLIFIRVIMSWFPMDRSSPVIVLLYRVTDPVIIPCREIYYSILGLFGMDARSMPLDFSPIIAYLVVDWLVRTAVVKLLALLLSGGF